MKLALIDHYDSFTFNVIGWLTDGGAEVTRVAFDDAAGMARLGRTPLPLVLSPGPKRPEDAAATVALVQAMLGKVPILGVCLGHQILAHVSGAGIVRSVAPFHGTTRLITPAVDGGLLTGSRPFRAAVYNSLVVGDGTLPPPWRVGARCEHGEIQEIHRVVAGEAPAYGVQFHPESFLSEGAGGLLSAWLGLCAATPSFYR